MTTTPPSAPAAVSMRAQQVAAEEDAQRVFSTSVAISAVRCLLSYVLFPFVAPVVGIASGVGSTIGIVTSTVAIAANVWSIRRFHLADHRWKWPITAINIAIIALLVVLLVLDVADLT